ncbi:bifunctional phosphoribosylaminoimidazolecarboxamide formyltransferase/IMP cyclohydrolase [Marinivivus vitaminiproducens]|uniref:bifunctional phosphoribosylaminoimidazolecarboxamide formyltransferase/IMP cyclohydrolase n=1 Tax=Marinivivus vitaminiproducens TaxID=3035935 RepID=UPI0027A1AC6D|nr:bifunctional phosphoribosylaminoimidazolecarboxamide formyltransferase/IMP cyclohydrolase [Geminicoccaceae bacterium SCSIO 64248]
MPDRPIRRALLSVYDKTGIADLGQALHRLGVELVSTGGTAAALRGAGLPVTEVADVTGFPEILDGRVKTLQPAIHAGLLARRDHAGHMETLAEHGFETIDLLVSNLYPFERTRDSGAPFDEVVEMIDIGGPAMIRAAAKNHDGVVVLTDPDDYAEVLTDLSAQEGRIDETLRRRLAAKAFGLTAAYDGMIADWLYREAIADEAKPGDGAAFGADLDLSATLRQTLRYGENPHQKAAFYARPGRRPGVTSARQVQGKELSYNNLNDTDAAFELVAEFDRPAAVIVKHANPSGVGVADDLAQAHAKALAADPVSAFGGIVALNRPLDAETARGIAPVFTEVVIAPDASEEALAILGAKKALRVLLTGALPSSAEPGLVLRSVAGGLLVQESDARPIGPSDLQIVTRRAPAESEIADLLFAVRVVKHVKSNAIVFARAGRTVGIGAGQMSRVDAVRIAAAKAAELAREAGETESRTVGSVLASDAFFPFADGLEAAIAAGVTAVIQPGGSKRDPEVIAAADVAGIAMVFTGIRHFRH